MLRWGRGRLEALGTPALGEVAREGRQQGEQKAPSAPAELSGLLQPLETGRAGAASPWRTCLSHHHHPAPAWRRRPALTHCRGTGSGWRGAVAPFISPTHEKEPSRWGGLRQLQTHQLTPGLCPCPSSERLCHHPSRQVSRPDSQRAAGLLGRCVGLAVCPLP